jgi:tetratricopeptide (TPR) repeat protein
MPVDAMALRIYPHAHYLAREMTVLATLPGGKTEPLLHISNWDFNWQDDYEYEQPVALPKGSTLQMRFVYDNSAANPNNPHTPPERVRFGPEATDEMGELLVQLVAKRPADVGRLRAEIARKTLASDIVGEEKRIADVPDDYEVHNSLGVHYVQAARLTDAVAQFEASLRLAPEHALAHYNLGLIALNLGRLDEARTHLEHALAARPDFAEAHSNFGVLLMRQGHTTDAIDHFERALAIKPDNLPAHNNLGRVLLATGRADEAIDHFQHIVQLQADNAPALQMLAEAYAAIGRFDQAMRTAQQALSRASAAKNDALVREIRQQLMRYEQQAEP